MIGIDDPFVLIAYFGIVAATLASLFYGLARRNAARDEITNEDRQWALEEKKVDDEL
ncbi:symporter small accessory protein [Imhoffiella purpurea]|uniref:Uncharacterized protein n=1 Tax=Imhoffiella purpurea TaxID=1249627 RepID=W9VHN5_9GAMM|nr:symporter small accessory protein [Imhoffiella purpurea]EXJ15562.1 hypothetical protein D779_1304 [Imhoffiella purpurea]